MSESLLDFVCPDGSTRSVIEIASAAIDKAGRFSYPHKFKARFDDIVVEYFTPFTMSVPNVASNIGYDIPDLRTHGYGFRIIDRKGICLFVIWVKGREYRVKFREPARYRWLQRLDEAEQFAVRSTNSERTARTPIRSLRTPTR
jgi:hypothetical protein